MSSMLADEGLKLEIWHSEPDERMAAQGNAVQGPWSVPLRERRLKVAGITLKYRSVHSRAIRARAVVAGLASTYLETYMLAADPRVNLMLWGHGRSYTSTNRGPDVIAERWLRGQSTHVFTYTESGKAYVVGDGTSSDAVTVLRNSTDTQRLWALLENLTKADETELRAGLQIPETARVGLFVGAYDEPKKLPILLAAADIVAARDPNFMLVLAGAGPDQSRILEYARTRQYVRSMGRVDEVMLAKLSRIVDVILIPGRIGLVAVDALALGLPIVTTQYEFHAPEAEYLTPNKDSVWTGNSVEEYAEGILLLLEDRERLKTMSQSAKIKGRQFSIEKTAERFVKGILAAL